MQRPAAQFFDALPPEVTAAELDPHYQRIERALQVAPGPQDARKLAALTDLAGAQKWELGPTPQAIRWTSDDPATRPPCTQCNRCMFSCNVGAKLSFDQTLIPSAVKAGAVVRDLCDGADRRACPGRLRGSGPRRAAKTRGGLARAAGGSGGGHAEHLEDTAALDGRPATSERFPRLGKHFSLAGDMGRVLPGSTRCHAGGGDRTHHGRADTGARIRERIRSSDSLRHEPDHPWKLAAAPAPGTSHCSPSSGSDRTRWTDR